MISRTLSTLTPSLLHVLRRSMLFHYIEQTTESNKYARNCEKLFALQKIISKETVREMSSMAVCNQASSPDYGNISSTVKISRKPDVLVRPQRCCDAVVELWLKHFDTSTHLDTIHRIVSLLL